MFESTPVPVSTGTNWLLTAPGKGTEGSKTWHSSRAPLERHRCRISERMVWNCLIFLRRLRSMILDYRNFRFWAGKSANSGIGTVFLNIPVEEVLSSPVLRDRKSTRLNSSHVASSYAVCCLQKND